MGGSRYLYPFLPGFLLTSIGQTLTANQQLVIQAITNGTYFVFNEVPAGAQNGSNQTYTLANAIKPVASLLLSYNGQYLQQGAGKDYTISGQTITLVNVKPNSSVGDVFIAESYTVSPV